MEQEEQYSKELEEERRESRLAALAKEAAARAAKKVAKKAAKLAWKTVKKVILKAAASALKWIVITIGGAVVGFIGFWGCLIILLIVVLIGIAAFFPEARESIFTVLIQGPYWLWKLFTGK